MFDLIKNFYETNVDKQEIEWKAINTYHNMWDVPPTIVHMNHPRSGGSPELQAKVWDMARDVMEEVRGRSTPLVAS